MSWGRPYETSCYIFFTVLSRLATQNLPKTLNHVQCRLLFVTGLQYHVIKMIPYSIKSPEDFPMRHPATYFITVLKRLTYPKLPKTLNVSQYIMSFVTGVQYHRIKVIFSTWYCNPVTNNSLHCIWFSDFGWLWVANLLKTVKKYVARRLIGTSSGLLEELAIIYFVLHAPRLQISDCIEYS